MKVHFLQYTDGRVFVVSENGTALVFKDRTMFEEFVVMCGRFQQEMDRQDVAQVMLEDVFGGMQIG